MALDKITTNIIEDDAVTAAKIVAGAVTADIPTGGVATAKLADDAVTPAKIAYLGDGSGNLSGTITNEQLHLGTAFTLTDDLTVNGDVTLGKVGDDSTGQSLTQDSSANRTLTGTGTLRMGSSLSSVNGMIGTLGSGVKFPPGHVIQTFYAIPTGSLNYTGSATTGLSITLSNVTSGSKIFLIFKYIFMCSSCSSSIYFSHFMASTDASTMGLAITSGDIQNKSANQIGRYGLAAWENVPITGTVLTTAVTTATPTYNIYHQQTGSSTVYFNSDMGYITAMEIAQ